MMIIAEKVQRWGFCCPGAGPAKAVAMHPSGRIWGCSVAREAFEKYFHFFIKQKYFSKAFWMPQKMFCRPERLCRAPLIPSPPGVPVKQSAQHRPTSTISSAMLHPQIWLHNIHMISSVSFCRIQGWKGILREGIALPYLNSKGCHFLQWCKSPGNLIY